MTVSKEVYHKSVPTKLPWREYSQFALVLQTTKWLHIIRPNRPPTETISGKYARLRRIVTGSEVVLTGKQVSKSLKPPNLGSLIPGLAASDALYCHGYRWSNIWFSLQLILTTSIVNLQLNLSMRFRVQIRRIISLDLLHLLLAIPTIFLLQRRELITMDRLYTIIQSSAVQPEILPTALTHGF